MKGILYKSKHDGWMVKYTTYKTIPGIKGVMGSHSRMPESNYLLIHPDTVLYPDGLWGQSNVDEFETVDFEIVPVCNNCGRDYCDNLSCRGEKDIQYAKLINEEKYTKRRQKKFSNIMEHNNIKRMYTEEDMLKSFEKGALYGSTKNGNTHYFDEVINSLNKQD